MSESSWDTEEVERWLMNDENKYLHALSLIEDFRDTGDFPIGELQHLCNHLDVDFEEVDWPQVVETLREIT